VADGSAARSAHVKTRRRRIGLPIGRFPDPFTLHAVDVQITPEPSPEEREAILQALAEERADEAEPSPWRAAALDDYEDPVGAGGIPPGPPTPLTPHVLGTVPDHTADTRGLLTTDDQMPTVGP